MSPKLLVVLVVLVVVLVVFFVVGVAWTPPPVSLETPPTWLKSFGGLIATPRPVQTQDIGSASPDECSDLLAGTPLTMTQSLSCALVIKEASDRVRTLCLQRLSGSVEVVYIPSDPNQVTLTLELGEDQGESTLQVFKDGGTLTLKCDSPLCVIAVGE